MCARTSQRRATEIVQGKFWPHHQRETQTSQSSLLRVTAWFVVFLFSLVALFCQRFGIGWTGRIPTSAWVGFWVVMLINFFLLYCWTCHHLATAKGYSTSLILLRREVARQNWRLICSARVL